MNPVAIRAIIFISAGVCTLMSLYVLPGTGLEEYAAYAAFVLGGWAAKTPGDVRTTTIPKLPFLALSMIALTACPPLPVLKTWPQYLECAPGVSDIVGVVSRVLLNGSVNRTTLEKTAKNELQQLAFTHGADVVACAISKLIEHWRSPGSAATPETLAASVRGENFLREVGVSR